MQNRITIIATLRLLGNKLSELKKVVKELQEHCSKTEQGMLQYDWYLLEDANTIKVIETYENSEAVLFHFDNYKPFASKLAECRSFVKMEVFGNASETLRQRVKKISAEHYGVIASFSKR